MSFTRNVSDLQNSFFSKFLNSPSAWCGKKPKNGDISGGPVVRNLLCDAEDTGWIPSQGTKIPHAVEHLKARTPQLENMCAITKESTCHN